MDLFDRVIMGERQKKRMVEPDRLGTFDIISCFYREMHTSILSIGGRKIIMGYLWIRVAVVVGGGGGDGRRMVSKE